VTFVDWDTLPFGSALAGVFGAGGCVACATARVVPHTRHTASIWISFSRQKGIATS
jgi:hypothetical protein